MRRWTSLVGVVALLGCDNGSSVPDAAIGGRDAFVPPGVDAPMNELDAPNALDAFSPGSDTGTTIGPDAFSPSGDAGSVIGAPSMRGPFAVTPSMTTVTRGTRMTTVRVFLPTLPADTRAPLIVFMPGFQLNSGQYAITLEHLASHGFVVLGADAPGTLFSVNHVEMAADGRAVIDWATSTAPFAASVDATLIGVTGHSLGGKLATLITMDDARIDALLGIDPVDGDPSPGGGGSPDRPDLVPARGTAVTVPAGFIGETVSGAGGFMPCAPAAQNFTQFYMATTAAPWAAQWDMIGADHMDFVDNPATCGFTCSVCADGPAVDATVVADTRTLATAFFRRHLRSELAMDAYLIGASIPAGAVGMHR